jgi:4-hydroxy-2-oxoheptanedioate aldolase
VDYLEWSNHESLVILLIEEKAAVEKIEEILAVKGIDVVVFGPSDYSISIGLPGQTRHPRVLDARRKVVKAAFRLNVAPMITCNTIDQVRECLEMGVRLLSLGGDARVLLQCWGEMIDNARKAFRTIIIDGR